MKNKIFKILFILLSILPFLSLPSLKAAVSYDSNLTWRSIKTEHFWIHYHQGLEDVASRMVSITEKVHARLSNELAWHPALRTDVILIDSSDEANGMATPIYFNTVEIYISRPMLDSVLANFDNWLESVFTHEYAHILNLDMAHGMPQVGRYILGRFPIFFPNIFQPIWITEGDAVYRESKGSKFGRNNSTYTDMIMRTEAATSGLKSIDRASSFPREWPKGNVPYLYGGLFVEYLDKTYGDGSFVRYLHENADNIIPFSDNIYPIPYFFNKDAKDVYSLSFFRLWEKWQIATYTKHMEHIKKISAQGITKYAMISPKNDNSILPRFSRDGGLVYYVSESPRKGNHLFKYDYKANKTAKLCSVNSPNSIAVSKNGDVLLADIELHRSFSMYYELFRYRKCYSQRSSRLRGNSIDAFHASDRYVIITAENDLYNLIITDPSLKNIEKIISNSSLQISFPRISPDDTKIVFTIKEPGGATDLAILDLAGKSVTRLTNDNANDIQPSWHPNGKKIIFSSDRTKVYNLFEYDLTAKKIVRMTNVIGGAFQPDISPAGDRIAFASYEEKGQRISLMDYIGKRYSTENAVTGTIDLARFSTVEKKPEKIPESRPYTPLHSGFPGFILPLIGIIEYYPKGYDIGVGFLILGSDALKQHLYSLQMMTYFLEGRLEINAEYTMAILYPNLIFGYSDDTIFMKEDSFPWKKKDTLFKREMQRRGYFSIDIPAVFYRHQHAISATYNIAQNFTDIYRPGKTVSHDESLLAWMEMAYFFSCSKFYTYSISEEDGCDLMLLGDIYHKYLGSDESFYVVRGDYKAYIPGFAANNVILLGLRGGIAFDYPSSQLAPFSLGKSNSDTVGLNSPGIDSWGMRGYGAGSLYGDRMAIGTFEYRLPLVQMDAGIITVPIMFRDLWLKIFYEYGNVWRGGLAAEDFKQSFKHSLGAELNVNITLGYALTVNCYTGYAYGFNTYGEHQVYFGINSIVEWRILQKNQRAKKFNHIR